jgi:hypothetical protein
MTLEAGSAGPEWELIRGTSINGGRGRGEIVQPTGGGNAPTSASAKLPVSCGIARAHGCFLLNSSEVACEIKNAGEYFRR